MWQFSYDSFTNWEVIDGTVDLLGGTGNNSAFYQSWGEGMIVDLDGWDIPGLFQTRQTFTFEPGKTYTLRLLDVRFACRRRWPLEQVRQPLKVGQDLPRTLAAFALTVSTRRRILGQSFPKAARRTSIPMIRIRQRQRGCGVCW